MLASVRTRCRPAGHVARAGLRDPARPRRSHDAPEVERGAAFVFNGYVAAV
jgi:hypothetical protein